MAFIKLFCLFINKVFRIMNFLKPVFNIIWFLRNVMEHLRTDLFHLFHLFSGCIRKYDLIFFDQFCIITDIYRMITDTFHITCHIKIRSDILWRFYIRLMRHHLGCCSWNLFIQIINIVFSLVNFIKIFTASG